MEKIGLILEGGGMRGAYTAGVLHWLLENDLHFDYVAGISSGALYAGMYVLNKPESLKAAATTVAADKRNVGIRPLLKEHTIVGYNFLYNEVTKNLDYPLDTINQIPGDIEIGVYDMNHERTVWKNKHDIAKNPELIQAACTLPIMGKSLKINGIEYMDGGITTMIPIQQSIDFGCAKHLVVTTKSKDYVRKPQKPAIAKLLKFVYRKYPRLVRDFNNRVNVYYKERALIDKMVDEKKALYMYPSKELGIGRTKGTLEQFETLFEIARQDCEARRDEIIEMYNSVKKV